VAARRLSAARRRALVLDNLDLVGIVARRLARRLPRSVRMADLRSAGALGLVEAAERYRVGKTRFRSFAEFRIRGAMIDELRSRDWLSRDLRKLATSMKAADRALTRELGRQPKEDEIAARIGMPSERLRRRRQRIAAFRIKSFEDLRPDFLDVGGGVSLDVDGDVDRKRQTERILRASLTLLPPKSAYVVLLILLGQNQKDIADRMHLSEARISQLVRGAVEVLKAALAPARAA
jgi:RNA polymerase sigma factor for flagellar operon FliA